MNNRLARFSEISSSIIHTLRLERFEGTVAVNIVSFGFNILTSVIAARLLGPQGRGELAAIQNWTFFAVSFGLLGIPHAAAYYAGKNSAQAGTIFATAQVFLLLLAIPVYAVTYALIPRLLSVQSISVIQNARIFLLLVFIQFGGYLPYFVLRGLGKLGAWNAVRMQFPILWLMIFIIGYLSGQLSASFVAQGYLIAMIFHCATWMAVMFLSVRGTYRPHFGFLPSFLRYGLPSMLSNVPRELNLRADQLLMAAFLPPQTLGLYVVAAAWGGLSTPIMSSFAQTVFPRLAALNNMQEQREFLQRTMHMSTLVGVLLGCLTMVLTPFVVPIVYGLDFKEAIPAACILTLAGFVSNLNSIIEESFRGIGMPKWPMVAEIMGLVCTVSLLLLLLPRYGLVGAAIASLGSYTFVFLFFLVLLNRVMGLSLVSSVIPTWRDVKILREYITSHGLNIDFSKR